MIFLGIIATSFQSKSQSFPPYSTIQHHLFSLFLKFFQEYLSFLIVHPNLEKFSIKERFFTFFFYINVIINNIFIILRIQLNPLYIESPKNIYLFCSYILLSQLVVSILLLIVSAIFWLSNGFIKSFYRQKMQTVFSGLRFLLSACIIEG